MVGNQQNAVYVLRLAPDGRTDFDVPTTVGACRDRLHLSDAWFTATPTPETTYEVVAADA